MYDSIGLKLLFTQLEAVRHNYFYYKNVIYFCKKSTTCFNP